eukprot:CAMPEP_0113973276 /NCGR_PEP_ID=MMETSP0011_2-20120614/14215_1 /TAXON_ID=101924 /ORGANISM="Rhodosorus marinus" /LENGTH=76 /DNA_ID=CAMNT_0000990891 /DNA_START=2481 /DNA_END=2711 /DNA_ORIENTATION=+ /assembly_acc=CAM_ASM_000156
MPRSLSHVGSSQAVRPRMPRGTYADTAVYYGLTHASANVRASTTAEDTPTCHRTLGINTRGSNRIQVEADEVAEEE